MFGNFLLLINEQDTSYRLYICHGTLAGNHNFVMFSYFLCLSSSMKLGPDVQIQKWFNHSNPVVIKVFYATKKIGVLEGILKNLSVTSLFYNELISEIWVDFIRELHRVGFQYTCTM